MPINLITRYETGDENDAPVSLLRGELAVNTQAGKLWVGNAGGSPVSLLEAPIITGTVEGQTLRWESTTSRWEPTSALSISDAGVVTLADLVASSSVDFTGATVSNLGTVTTADINGGTIDATVIGSSNPAAGSFTSLSASGNITVTGTVDGRDIAADGSLLDTALQPADNVSELTNDAGYLTTVSFGDLTSTPTTLAGYGITDAATSAQGSLADSAIQAGDDADTLGSGVAPDGFVLTADGAGGADWEAAAGGGGGGSSYNYIINGDFTVNQRGAVSKNPGVGDYGFDRWKGNDASNIEQVVEYDGPAVNMTLAWTGGGTGSLNGTSGTSPITAAVSAGTNFSVIVPNASTEVVCVEGNTAADYTSRNPQEELALCQRYFFNSDGVPYAGFVRTATTMQCPLQFPVPMVSVPTISLEVNGNIFVGASLPLTATGLDGAFSVTELGLRLALILSSGQTVGQGGTWYAGTFYADAEL